MHEILLLRHGQVESSRPWNFLGQRHQPLTDEGRNQMREWRDILADKPVAAVVCSDIKHSRDSAEILLGRNRSTQLTIDPGFREISLGAWEGLSVAEVEERFPGAYRERGLNMGDYAPQGGESFTMLQNRTLAALDRTVRNIPDPDGPIVVVTHIGVCRVLVAHVLQIPLPAIFYLEQRYGRAHHLAVKDGRLSIAGLNMPAKAYDTDA